MSLQDKLDAFKAEFETKHAPPAVVAAMHRATQDLIASDQAKRTLKVGDRMPHFELADTEGGTIDSEALLAKGPLVISFYRGVWCPYCNLDLQALETIAADIRWLGATLVSISPQTPANNRKAKEQHSLTFPLLSDPLGKVAHVFGLRFRLAEEINQIYKGFGVDLSVFNADSSYTLPMPARYIVAPNGVIAYAEVSPDYTRRPDPSELLPTLLRLHRDMAA